MKKIVGVKKIIGVGASTLAAGAALASAVLISPTVAHADPGTASAVNVVGETYAKAVSILKSQGVQQRFNGAVSGPGGPPQAQCIVDQQKSTSKGVMLLHLDCTAAAASAAAGNAPAPTGPAAGGTTPGGPTPGNGQGTYGGPIGVPVNVGG